MKIITIEKNQVSIFTKEGIYFFSYDSLAAKRDYKTGNIYLIRGIWNYSKTTLKYLKIWLKKFCGSEVNGVKEINKLIEKGILKEVYENEINN